MLSSEETISLLRRAKKGDKGAKEVLINENSPLIKSVIKRFIGKGIDYDDLFQLGSLGFLKAIGNFDEKFGVRFSTYAVPMILGEVKRFIRDDGSIKVSRAIKSLSQKMHHFASEFEAKNGRYPSTNELSDAFNIDPQEVVFTMDSCRMPLSLYGTKSDDNSKQPLLLDKFYSLDQSDELSNHIVLKDALASLDERDKKIVLVRFFRDKTQSEIATELGVSQVQVSRLENKIIEKLRSLVI